MTMAQWRCRIAIVLLVAGLARNSTALAQPVPSSFEDAMATEAAWITGQAQASCPNSADGAIGQSAFPASGAQIVDAYRGNFAAIGLLAAGPAYYSNVERWATWYINHINWPDNLNQYATIYWYDVDANFCTEAPSTVTKGLTKPGYDAQDSWAATYLTLMAAWAKADPVNATAFIDRWAYQLDAIANAAYAMRQPASGLTGAKVNWLAQYLMDNSEVVEGLNSYVWVATNVLRDPNKVNYWTPRAQGINTAIQTGLWQQCGAQTYCDAYGDTPLPWASCYPAQPTNGSYEYFWDNGLTGEAQVWPALSRVAPDNAVAAFQKLDQYCPTWKTEAGLPSTQSGYPLLTDSGIGLAAAIAGNTGEATTWLSQAAARWMVDHPWPWTVFDAGNAIRTANLLNGGPDPVP
ncbi:MAG TPA: hypothetical protein VGV37_20775 [Aliidongia sp.]|uniref:hypothetical protein n=1 Tax=Aliidongia sp. TaxID=1914230 RepID=UPI002DDD188B|nr:hypothetical protein [Aliidongia sp.]HEV2676975.1 hypothetical protein [Aliidongia sp.]